MTEQMLHAVSPHVERERKDSAAPAGRPHVAGKFLAKGAETLLVRGVTYGTFAPGSDGSGYERAAVSRDFSLMAEHGINAVRTYTVPPAWLLDCASESGLLVMVGLPWEQHVAFLDERRRQRSIRERVGAGVAQCAGHPAVLAYTIGNEIPAPIVRWHGRRPVERFLESLYETAKSRDPEGLVTYVNFPTTEYLELPFLDFLSFNVYLEQREKLEGYLYRLQNLAGDRPLMLAEIGLDSRRNGLERQATSLEWQIRSAFAGGCAGTFAFAWTDEWWRGGLEIEDWDFGLTTRSRVPKPALKAVEAAYDEAPLAPRAYPRFSVVVCTYNGSATLGSCLEGLAGIDYPNYEVIVVDDGSTDGSAEIAEAHGVRVVRTANRGLASARNTGMDIATGEVLAYLDDDARPDPHWLSYLAEEFDRHEHCAVGGPNIPPPGDGLTAEAVAHSPGGPIHVLLSDSVAEHIPGCNMAIRTQALRDIGGFDPQFRAAGDDVDVCWRLQEQGWTIGFAPAAFVWHHRRSAVRGYLRQQRGYGKAEALLERKWPERYNRAGHIRWEGRLYGSGRAIPLISRRQRVYHGTWGSGLFQSVYEPSDGSLASLPMMPEWNLALAGLAVVAGAGAIWGPLLWALPVLLLAAAISLAGCLRSAARTLRTRPASVSPGSQPKLLALTALLHLLQPVARLQGRLAHGLSPWRLRAGAAMAFPRTMRVTAWSEIWSSPEGRLRALERGLRDQGVVTRCGGDFDTWDLEVRCGTLAAARAVVAVEEHGQGKQLVRLRCWPRVTYTAWAAILILGALSTAAALDDAFALTVAFAVGAIVSAIGLTLELAMACGALRTAFETVCREMPEPLPAEPGRPGSVEIEAAG